ncbi:MAG TPA: low molecular weight protein arginine phosphatase [candidate division WOR-3 bacterium]|uniref:Low molecular weight protein arginine phosphatase n=2 Tax=candidate division WOR-3 bacterium TaxID=2052148 RepID=A0A7V0XEI5_UNCW3|nr:low molecular weight protein arginine phosphatase [candidate division WOR-3 bacterium]
MLVVCTGNMCRSPMAHGVLAQMLAGERVFVYSAGTDAPAGAPATRAAVEAAAGLGADISGHRAQLLNAELVAGADLVLVMEEYHRRRVLELACGEGSRVRLLGEYLPGAEPGREIADPVGRPLEVYREALAGLARALEQVAGEVRRRL